MAQFGLLGDMVAVRDTTPHIKLASAYLVNNSRWAYYDHNGIHRQPGRSSDLDVTPDANPILRYHLHRSLNGTNYLFCFTKDHAYIWSSGTSKWTAMFTCSASCTHWSTASFNDKVIATNGVDLVQVWSAGTPGTAFADFGTSKSGLEVGDGVYMTKAKYVLVYRDYIHFFNVMEGGTAYPNMHRWGNHGQETFKVSTSDDDAGYRLYAPGNWVTGCGVYTAGGNDLLVAFTNRTIETEWLVVDATVFNWKTANYKLGCIAADSIVNDAEGNLYFFGSDYHFHRFLTEARLSDDLATTVQTMHPTLCASIRAKYIQRYNRIWWAFPSGGSLTGNDKVLSLNLDLTGWDPILDMAVSAFGEYVEGTTYTIDSIPFGTIDGITWETIDSNENVAGWPLEIAGDYSGYSYRINSDVAYDMGAAYESIVQVGTDLTQNNALEEYKRIHGLWTWFNRQVDSGYEAKLSIQGEADDTPESIGTVALDGGTAGNIIRTWTPCDVRSRDFIIQVSASNDFHLYGILIDYDVDGNR